MPTRLRKLWLFAILLLFCGWLLAQNLFSNRASNSGYGQFRLVPAVGLVDQPIPTSAGSEATSLDARIFGVKCDGSTNDSASLQSAINAANNGTTPSLVVLPPGTCLANVNLPTGVVLSGGMQYFSVYAHNWGKPTTILKTADKTGATAVVSVANNAAGAGVVGLELYGRGSGSGDRGVYIPHGSRIYVGPNVTCDNFGEECVRWESGTSLYVNDIYAINSLINHTRSQHSGTIYVGGTDAIIKDSEVGCSLQSYGGGPTSSNMYIDGIVIYSGNNWIRDTVSEFCDEGLYIDARSAENRIEGLRSDHSYGNGIEVDGDFNQLTGVFSQWASWTHDGTYDAYVVNGRSNVITGSTAHSYAGHTYRYGFTDGQTSAASKNTYVGSRSYSHASGVTTYGYNVTSAYVDVISTCPGCTTGAPLVIAAGTARLINGAIGSGGCATTLTTTATGTRATDSLKWSYAGAPTIADSLLILSPYVTTDHVNFVLCNPTAKSLPSSGLVVNWEVLR